MILITGYTGNTGSLVLNILTESHNGNNIIGVARKSSLKSKHDIKTVNIDLNDSNALDEIFEKYPIKSIIHIANIKFSNLILEKANEYRVDKVVLVHTTGVYSKFRSFSSLYKEIEEKIMNNSYEFTNYIILRPTMIYGNENDHNMHKLIKFLSKSPVFPIFGNGLSLMQPVHVEDLAEAIVSAHFADSFLNEDFDISGGNIVTYKDVIEEIKYRLGKKTKIIYIPIKLAIIGAKILEIIMKKPIITSEQVKRLQEDKAYSNEKAKNMLNFNPRNFNEGIQTEIEILKGRGIIK